MEPADEISDRHRGSGGRHTVPRSDNAGSIQRGNRRNGGGSWRHGVAHARSLFGGTLKGAEHRLLISLSASPFVLMERAVHAFKYAGPPLRYQHRSDCRYLYRKRSGACGVRRDRRARGRTAAAPSATPADRTVESSAGLQGQPVCAGSRQPHHTGQRIAKPC